MSIFNGLGPVTAFILTILLVAVVVIEIKFIRYFWIKIAQQAEVFRNKHNSKKPVRLITSPFGSGVIPAKAPQPKKEEDPHANVPVLGEEEKKKEQKTQDQEPVESEKDSQEKESTPKKKKNQTKKKEESIEDILNASEDTIDESDLTVVEGIGPKIEMLLKESDIVSWEDLSKASVAKLRSLLALADGTMKTHDPTTWPEQARLAHEHKWEELKVYQDELIGGRE